MTDYTTGAPGARSLREWIANPELLIRPPAVIPHFAVDGRVTLFSGREKIGKSTLAACVVAEASRGDAVFGLPVAEPIRTLWYSIDEPVGDTIRRFSELGTNMDNVFVSEMPRTAAQLREEIAIDTHAFDVHLVVVDNLSRIFSAGRLDSNQGKDAGPLMNELVNYFHEDQLAAILLYHTGKAGREYLGSVQIGASVDEVLTLRKRGTSSDDDDFDDDAPEDGRRLLVQDRRNLRGRLQLIHTDGAYRLYDGAAPLRVKILTTLRNAGSVKSRNELAKLVGGKRETVLATIADLIAYHAITESGHRLTLAPRGLSELAGSVPESVGVSRTTGTVSTATPDPHTGSQRFPLSGTTPEPTREPDEYLCEVGSEEEQRITAKIDAEVAA